MYTTLAAVEIKPENMNSGLNFSRTEKRTAQFSVHPYHYLRAQVIMHSFRNGRKEQTTVIRLGARLCRILGQE